MGTEAFYATAAQVLPTLLIALMVEIGFILQHGRQSLQQLERSSLKDKPGVLERYIRPDYVRNTRLWRRVSLCIGLVFFVGEVLALSALAFRWFNGWTFGGIAFSAGAMTVAAALIPLSRLRGEGVDQ